MSRVVEVLFSGLIEDSTSKKNQLRQPATRPAPGEAEATVKGDVHDIGKNIVGVVLGCNNYKVGVAKNEIGRRPSLLGWWDDRE